MFYLFRTFHAETIFKGSICGAVLGLWTSAQHVVTQPVLSLSPLLQAQVFLNQLYKTPVEPQLDKNPDLRAIRFASFNPILDPWIYILLRKAVLHKLIEKIKCLFCKIGAQRQGSSRCIDAYQLSSVASKQDAQPYAQASEPSI